MHMANELLSPAVAAGSVAVAAGAVGFVCHKAKRLITSDKFALMGIMGAFVFAAQMVNFPLPFMPGTSGHIVGAVLLAIILGPWLATIVLSSVVIIQCLIFQDGGLLALGCNIINMAIAPTFLGYYVYQLVSTANPSPKRMYLATVIASTVGLVVGAMLVTIQVRLSGVLLVPTATFLITMVGVHTVIGIIEGLITAAVLLYLRNLRPQIMVDSIEPVGPPRRLLYATVLAASLVIGAGLSLLASDKPDGLEWSYSTRPDQSEFKPMVSNENSTVEAVEEFQSRYSPLPDYSIRTGSEDVAQAAMGWTSFAAVAGSAMTMAVVWLVGWAIRKRDSASNAPYPN